jgi:hypothetical protein
MANKLNVAIGADITALKKGFDDAVVMMQQSGQKMSTEVAEAAKDIQKRLDALAKSKPTARVVRQLQTMAMEARAMGPAFADMANQFIREAGRMQDEIGDTRAEIGYFASDTRRLDAAIGGAQAVAAGFGLIEGSMAALGVESDDMQKTMAKLQGAMLALTSLQTITNLLQKESALVQGALVASQNAYTFAVAASTSALGVFKLALIATGIGAAIAGVAYLAANFDKLKEKIWPAEAALKAYNKAVEHQIRADQYAIDIATAKGNKMAEFAAKERKLIHELDQARRNYGKNEKENWGKIIADTKNALKVLGIERDNYIAEEKEKQAKANQDRANKFTQDRKQAKQNELMRKAELLTINDGTLNELLAAENAAFSVRVASMREQGYTEIEINKLRNAALDKVRTDYNNKKSAAEEKEKRDAEQRAKDLLQLETDIAKATAVTQDQKRALELAETTSHYTKLIEDAKKAGKDTLALVQAQAAAENAIKEGFRKTDEQKANESRMRQLQFQADMFAQYSQAVIAFNDAIVGKGDEAARKQAKRAKALSLAQALISTYFSAQLAYQSQFMPVPDPSSPVRGGVAAGAAVAAGLANVSKIATQKFADGGIVYGPTLGLMGEYPGARSNPEVIAPLNKLKDIIGSGGNDGGYIATTHISGRDLAIILQKHNNDYSRG